MTWRDIKYTRDHQDIAGTYHFAGSKDRIVTELAEKIQQQGLLEILPDEPWLADLFPGTTTENISPESVAIAEKTSDNVVMSDSQPSVEFTSDVTSPSYPYEVPLPSMSIPTFAWSEQQEAAYQWVDFGTGHAVMIAVAGSGKTTTLVECFKRIVKRGQRVVFLAFNHKIAKEIRAKVLAAGLGNSVKISTFHAHGMGLWMRANRDCKVEGDEPGNAGYWKFDRIMDELFNEGHGEMPVIYKSFVKKAWNLSRQNLFGFEINLMDKEAWLKLVDHHDLDEEIAEALLDEQGGAYRDEASENVDTTTLQEHVGKAINWTVRVIRKGVQIANEVIDFEDMLYMPLISQIHVYQNDWVLVDEAQDTNPSRRAYVAKILRPTGRTLWVGDPAQAIYGFTGADSQSIASIQKRFGAVQLDLTVTYRCPQVVVQKAQKWVKHIQAHPSAPMGQELTIQVADLLNYDLTVDDVILCRNNRPLVELALALLRKGIPCHVEGRDIATGLVKLVSRWKTVKSLDALTHRLESYRDREVQKAMARGKEGRAQDVADQVEVLVQMIQDMPRGSSLSDLESKIYDMFLDSEKQVKPTLTLSSIHKAKGREWNRVFWYGPERFQPSKFARKDWQREQERNLMYVAVTRTKQTLVTVVAADKLVLNPKKVAA